MNEKIPIVLLTATLSACWWRKTLQELAPLRRELAQDLAPCSSELKAQSNSTPPAPR